MIFSSYAFIFAFFPIVYIGYLILSKLHRDDWRLDWRKVWLLGTSLCFYSYGSPALFFLLFGTMIFNYAVIVYMSRSEPDGLAKKVWLALAVMENLGLLFYFKYFNFFTETVNRLFSADFPLIQVVLPLGISFYTFQILSYVVEVYRGNSEKSPFLDYGVFVTFFPQLIVGPIIRHDDMVPQLRSEGFGTLQSRNIMLGVLLFSIGCFKKIIIADPLIDHAQYFYNVLYNGHFFEAWGGVISYTFAYYFDFSGYIDMALGLGLFFNVKLPQNFDSPYKARNFADFWRRWNITVSQFFQDYVFKSIFHFGNRMGRLIFATLVTFLVSGLWHGAGWHFIFWGLANGILVAMANVMTLKRKQLPFPLAWSLTFFFTMLVRVLFDAGSMSQALSVYKSLLDLRPLFSDPAGFWAMGLDYITINQQVLFIALAAAAICFFTPNTREIAERFQPKWYYAAFSGLLFVTALFFMGRVSNFLYFQF